MADIKQPLGKERRVWVRYPCDVTGLCQRAMAADDMRCSAKIRDVSRGGLNLLSSRRFEFGTLLRIEVESGRKDDTRMLIARVVHVLPLPGGSWGLGCTFANPLSKEDFRYFRVEAIEEEPAKVQSTIKAEINDIKETATELQALKKTVPDIDQIPEAPADTDVGDVECLPTDVEFVNEAVAADEVLPPAPTSQPPPTSREGGPKGPEDRVHVRVPCNVDATYLSVGEEGLVPWPAKVLDISCGGTALTVTRRFESGAILNLELCDRAGQVTRTVLARVAHVTALPNGDWVLGCRFAKPLSQEDINTFT